MRNVGILGGGQLARMLALAGYPIGLHCTAFDTNPNACAGAVAPLTTGSFDDASQVASWAQAHDVITLEFENVPAGTVAGLAHQFPVAPGADALRVTQDRLEEKQLFGSLGIRTAPFAAVRSLEELTEAIARIGVPAVLKTRRFGYDGKGQFRLQRPEQAEEAWRALNGAPAILEGFVPFDAEYAIVAVRNRAGEVRCYPPIRTVHHDGILRFARPLLDAELQRDAQRIAQTVSEALRYVGVITIETFAVQGALLGNEIAPRVHNSAHWTIEGAETSQFENHLRAVCDLPLGDCSMRGECALVNLLGELPSVNAVLALPGVHLHDYGKEARPGRKVGHLTVTADTASQLAQRLEATVRLLPREVQDVARQLTTPS